jgi:hypothetical protein
MAEDAARLKKTSAKYFKFDNNGFSATVERDRENLVFFSIPYDEGWTATVNGKPCEIEKVNVGFMAVKVGKGTSDIRFTYMTPGLKLGVIITTLSAVIFLAYVIGFNLYAKTHKAVNEYPEGDEFLKQWRVEEIADTCSEMALQDMESKRQEKPHILDNIPDKHTGDMGGGFKGGFTVEIDKLDNKNDGK